MDRTQLACLLREHGLAVEHRDGWLRLYLQRGRQRGMACVAFVVGLAFLAAPLVLPVYVADAPYAGTIILAVAGTFGLCLVALAFYLPFNALEVRISRRKMIRVRTWLGLVVRTREVDLDELEELEIDRSASSSGNPITICYELVGRGRFGRFKLVESIPDRSLVEAVRAQVMIAAGLRPSPTH